MKLKYSPISSSRNTAITIPSVDAIEIDGELYEVRSDAVAWPDIAEQTQDAILEAHREDGELCLTILRRYSGARPQWDDGQYHAVKAGEAI